MLVGARVLDIGPMRRDGAATPLSSAWPVALESPGDRTAGDSGVIRVSTLAPYVIVVDNSSGNARVIINAVQRTVQRTKFCRFHHENVALT
ncbi:hypothetical protein EVAR_35998_1 [Eumeta japonica]|uniref:Uncharacterized protein n=1 Tax=Eumeta variegata TaxID=151549 RepID=A0A4C1WT37_EUMVA|nr:hypothetical protein EVAR_35998_1 [Eumeta japonica]